MVTKTKELILDAFFASSPHAFSGDLHGIQEIPAFAGMTVDGLQKTPLPLSAWPTQVKQIVGWVECFLRNPTFILRTKTLGFAYAQPNLLTLFLLLLLTSCATITTPPTPTAIPTTSWQERQLQLTRLQHWQIQGKIGVQTSNDSGSATVDWVQEGKHYQLTLLGPLGTQQLKLTGTPHQVIAETSDKQYQATTPETLVKQTWGFELPVSYLRYWVRGLPFPGAPFHGQYDNLHRLTTFTQQGFYIQYLSYQSISNIDLPERITLTSPLIKIKMVIHQWKLR